MLIFLGVERLENKAVNSGAYQHLSRETRHFYSIVLLPMKLVLAAFLGPCVILYKVELGYPNTAKKGAMRRRSIVEKKRRIE